MEYLDTKNAVFYRLGLDSRDFMEDWRKGEIDKGTRSPSPIRRLEETMFLAAKDGVGLDLTMLDESIISLNPAGGNVKRALFASHKPTLNEF